MPSDRDRVNNKARIPPPPSRTDSVETRAILVKAVTELMSECGTDFNLAAVATRAGTSTATAYRQLLSKEAAIELTYNAWVDRLCTEIATVPRQLAGLRRLQEACRRWVSSAMDWGPAAVYVRSPRGVLQRLHEGDPVLTKLWATLAPVLEDCIERQEVPAQDLHLAFLTWCSLFDERNILDLASTTDWSSKRISTELTGILLQTLGPAKTGDVGVDNSPPRGRSRGRRSGGGSSQ
jgi:AcrR family transcriptional regulator